MWTLNSYYAIFLTSSTSLLRWIVPLVTQVARDWVGLDHLHKFQDQRTTVFLRVGSMVHLALAQGVAGHLQFLVADILLSQHGRSGEFHLLEAVVVDVVEGDQLRTGVVVVGAWC